MRQRVFREFRHPWCGSADYAERQSAFYAGLRHELVEAARVDGASLGQVWRHVMLPLVKG